MPDSTHTVQTVILCRKTILVSAQDHTKRIYTLDEKIAEFPVVTGYAVAQLVESMRYKSEGRGFDSR
jgi:hypothetical protein